MTNGTNRPIKDIRDRTILAKQTAEDKLDWLNTINKKPGVQRIGSQRVIDDNYDDDGEDGTGGETVRDLAQGAIGLMLR